MSGAAELQWLDPHDHSQPFPDPATAFDHPNGLLAAGGNLHPHRLINAYRQGIFPWYGVDEPILWWSPNPRAVLRVGHLHRSRSMRRAWNRADFACTTNQAFCEVLSACSRMDTEEGVWLGSDMQAAYTELHLIGVAHSVEVWRSGELIGGIYGVLLGKVFFGESMFSHATNGSKFALCALEDTLAHRGALLLDGQVASPHLMRLGFELWPRENFTDTLETLCRSDFTETENQWELPHSSRGAPTHAPPATDPGMASRDCQKAIHKR